MLFLFNDRIFEVGEPIEIVRSDSFPLSPEAFLRLGEEEMLSLVREEIFANALLVHQVPGRAQQLATIIAAKTNKNAMLAGPLAGGAHTPEQIAILLAEVKLLTLATLYQQQESGTLAADDVETSVWAALR